MDSPYFNSHLLGLGSAADTGMMGIPPFVGGVPPQGGAVGRVAPGGVPGEPSWAAGLESGNFTGLFQVFSNMTATELVSSLQSAFLAALVRQYLFNDFFAGGVGLMLVSLVGSQVRRFYDWVRERLERPPQGRVQLRIERGSDVYTWLQEWLRQHSKLSSTNYDVETYWEDDDDSCSGDYSEPSSDEKPKMRFLPEFKEAQCVVYQGEQVWVQSKSKYSPRRGGEDREGEGILAMLRSGNSSEDLILSGSSSELLRKVLEEAMEAFLKSSARQQVTDVMRWSCDEMYWNHVGTMKARPLDSVVLECDVGLLLEDAKRFMASAAWYTERGIPHRRGYLLHGPPGCGKTSLIKAVAGELKLDVSLISLSAKELTDDILGCAMARLQHRSIFVLEDVDAAFAKDPQGGSTSGGEARVGMMGNGLSFSGLLNAIDGIAAQEGRIVIMTTNHIEKLDPALIRPGRIDLRLYLGLMSSTQIRGIFRRFYPDASQEDEDATVSAVPPNLLSPATLQGFFLLHRDDVAAMRQGLPAFVAQAQAGKDQSNTEAGREANGQADGTGCEANSGDSTGESGEEDDEGEEVGSSNGKEGKGKRRWWLRRRRR